jgi:hypothetical protein
VDFLKKIRWLFLVLSALSALGIVITMTPFGSFLLFYSDCFGFSVLFFAGTGQLIDFLLEKNESDRNRLLYLKVTGIFMILVSFSMILKVLVKR